MNNQHREKISVNEITGQTERHLNTSNAFSCSLHKDTIVPLQRLRESAASAGFDLQVASGFRSFDRQLTIWNAKASGNRPVYDNDGLPLDMARLSPYSQVFAILRWSALPGASRHHWGSDIDIFDAAAMPVNYQLQLTVAETVGEGPFAPLHQWLDTFLATDKSGFFRPYSIDRGGVAPEPWHLSYAPIAKQYQQILDIERLEQVIAATDISLKETVLANIEEIFQRYVQIPWAAYPLGIGF